MTYRLRFSDQALDDLSSIGSYLKEASGSARIADSFVERLIVRCEDLATLPGTLGRDRSELKADMRSMALGNAAWHWEITSSSSGTLMTFWR